MNPKEKQDYIDKIQNLIESNEEENLSLALQLMEGLGLTKDILRLYGLEEEDIKGKFAKLVLKSYKPEDQKSLIRLSQGLLYFWKLNNSQKRKIFNILIELIGLAHYELDSLKEKMNFFIYIKQRYLYIKTNIIAETDGINQAILKINQVNPLSKEDIKKYYNSKLISPRITNKRNTHLNWIDIRRKSKNPIEYQIQAYEENPEYSIFTVIVKVNI